MWLLTAVTVVAALGLFAAEVSFNSTCFFTLHTNGEIYIYVYFTALYTLIHVSSVLLLRSLSKCYCGVRKWLCSNRFKFLLDILLHSLAHVWMFCPFSRSVAQLRLPFYADVVTIFGCFLWILVFGQGLFFHEARQHSKQYLTYFGLIDWNAYHAQGSETSGSVSAPLTEVI